MIKNTTTVITFSLLILACSESEPQGSIADSVSSETSTQPNQLPASDAAVSVRDASGLANGGSSTTEGTSQSFDAQINNDGRAAAPVDSSSNRGSDVQGIGGNVALVDASTSTEPGDNQPVDANTGTSDSCDRACLIRFLDDYLNALISHDPNAIKVAPNLRATESAQDIALGDGLMKTATALRDFREDFIDIVQGQAGSLVVLEENGAPVLLTLRLKVENRQVTEIETIVSRTGAHMFFAPDALVVDPVFDEIVPEPQRNSREELASLANGYFDALENNDGSMLVFDRECVRVENGIVPPGATGELIGAGLAAFTYIEEIERRIPIIDEERGIAFGFGVFHMPSRSRSMLLGEVFKIVDSRFRMIHAFLLNVPVGTPSGW